MLLIAHRGNINGKNPEKENTVDYLQEAINKGYDVELDVRYIDGVFYLGHDDPQEECPEWLLQSTNSWVHAKDITTLQECMDRDYSNVFFHDSDDAVLTSSGLLWTFPGKELTIRSIQVMPEYVDEEFNHDCFGICSDKVGEYNGNRNTNI